MKKQLFIILGALLFFCSCGNNSAELNDYNCTITFEDEEMSPADGGRSVDILRERVKSIAGGNIKLEKSDGEGNWNLAFRTALGWDEVKKLLTSTGRFEIWETYSWGDISKLGDYIMTTAMGDMERYESLAWYMNDDYYSITLKGLPAAELEKVKELIWKAGQAGLIPERMVVFESAGSDGNTDVYILKSAAGGGAAMDNSAIADAEAVTSKHDFQPTMNVSFTEVGKESFSALTAANVGRTLVFVLDGNVLMSPMVNGEIVGGKCSIVSDFTPESAKVLAAILASGTLDKTVVVERHEPM